MQIKKVMENNILQCAVGALERFVHTEMKLVVNWAILSFSKHIAQLTQFTNIYKMPLKEILYIKMHVYVPLSVELEGTDGLVNWAINCFSSTHHPIYTNDQLTYKSTQLAAFVLLNKVKVTHHDFFGLFDKVSGTPLLGDSNLLHML